MTFFYDLNKKLAGIAKPQLNESAQPAVAEGSTGDYSAKKARAGKDIGKPGKAFAKIAKSAGERYGSKERGEKVAGAVLAKLRGKRESIEQEGNAFGAAVRKAKADGIQPGEKVSVGGKEYPVKEEGGVPMTPKQKKFAKLAPPKDKITFADKIAGAKKEVDEMLGDVAAEAMRNAVGKKKVVADEGWDEMEKMVKARANKPKVGSVERGHKHDIEHTATGRKVTRRHDEKGISAGADDESDTEAPKRGRGRPKGSKKAMGAKGPSGKSKLMTKEADHDSGELKKAMAVLKKAGYKISKGEQELDEKAVSKAQQKFMGMAHAMQKGEKVPGASKELKKVAKTMKKKDVEDFAKTKHKGLPEKVKSKKREKTEEQGGTNTPTASSGFSFGQGVYDSINRELEDMIAESMNINMSSSSESGPSLSVSASDDDAMKLAQILKMAGLGGDHGTPGSITSGPEIEVVQTGDDHGEECEVCGSADCGCGDVHEALDENNPDWPTDEVKAQDNLEYSGGLNGPKSTGQTVGAPFNRQNARQGAGDLVGNGVQEDLDRLKSLAKTVGGAVKSVAKKGLETLGHGSDEDMIKDLQKKVGVAQTGKKPDTGKVAESLRAALEQYKKQ